MKKSRDKHPTPRVRPPSYEEFAVMGDGTGVDPDSEGVPVILEVTEAAEERTARVSITDLPEHFGGEDPSAPADVGAVPVNPFEHIVTDKIQVIPEVASMLESEIRTAKQRALAAAYDAMLAEGIGGSLAGRVLKRALVAVKVG